MKNIIVLGSTGSIGLNTLDVVRKNSEQFNISGLTCHRNTALLAEQINEFKPKAVAVSDSNGGSFPFTREVNVFSGPQGVCDLVRSMDADIVVNGISGSKGLLPSITALETKKHLALANKETIVMAGGIVKEISAKNNVSIIPVDSEHAALFQLLKIPRHIDDISQMILTASGGPFREYSVEELQNVTLEDALKHPTYSMGEKISVDSATMANKGLEVIEAHYLFDIPVEKIKVVIHPQSIIHSLIRSRDGFYYAQMSLPDMRIPILAALSHPETGKMDLGVRELDLVNQSLTFLDVDLKKYGMLKLGFESAREKGPYPIVFNAANEVAVAAFIAGEIPFTGILNIVGRTLDMEWQNLLSSLEDILYCDRLAREKAQDILLRFNRFRGN
ncbi:MAG: 1-deoxy-D-xylulose-5-phosphate reductoisomerase, partial [Spirochaetales bacterium]|nr:1-deoxy-D-xylulose-5-phosphate reductoisomerase [Spirochaetales bacterium]